MSDACLRTVTDSIRDLEKEKSSLESRLDEVRQRRLCLEDTHSVWHLHLSQSSQDRARSLQHLHLAQNELGQSHAKLNTLRELFDRKNESVKNLHKQIEEEKARQMKAASEHESVMESIGQSLKDLKSQYSPDELKSQIQNIDEQIKRLKVQTSAERHRDKTLQEKLEKLTTGSDSAAGGAADGTDGGWKDLEMIRSDQQLIQSMLYEDQVKLKERICSVTHRLQDLEMEVNQLKD